MKRLILVLLLKFVFFPGNSLVAQNTWSLNQCISFSIKNNIGLKKLEIQEKLATEDLNQSKRNLLPGISASSNAGISFGRSVDPNTNDIVNREFFNNSYDIGASITLFNGFRLLNQIEYQKFRKRASELNRSNAVDDLAFRVMNSYFEVLYFEGLLGISRSQVETTRINLKKVERQVELGMKSKPDLLEMQANFEAEELKRIQVENNLKKSMLQLKQCMNLTDTTTLRLEEVQPLVENTDIPKTDNLFTSYLQWSPYYQLFEAQFKADRRSLAISRSQLLPSLNAYGSVGTGYYETTKDESGKTIRFRTQINNNLSQYVGGTLSIPVFGRWAIRANIKRAKLEVEQSQNTLDQEKQRLYFEMTNNLNEMESIEKEYNQYLKQCDADKLAFQAAEKKMEQGFVSVVDFYIAKNRLSNSESQLLKTRLQWEVKKKVLDFYSGKRFWE